MDGVHTMSPVTVADGVTRFEGVTASMGFVPIVNLVNPSPQSITPEGMRFDEWTFYIKFEDTGTPLATEFFWQLTLSGNDFAQLRYLPGGNVQLQIRSGGATTQSFAYPDGTFLNGSGDGIISISARENDTVVYINNTLAEDITSVTMPTGTPTGMGIGQTFAGGNQWSNAIREFQYYNQRLPDTLVQGLGG